MILSGIDLVMRLVIIERSSAPKEWFQEDQEKYKDTADDETPKKLVSWSQLLKQPRLITSLALTIIVATVLSAFEVHIYISIGIKILTYLSIAYTVYAIGTRMGIQCSRVQSNRVGIYGTIHCIQCLLRLAM